MLECRARDWDVRELILDTDSVNISKESVEPICAEYGCILNPASRGAPQENSKAERLVQEAKNGIRALMIGAPHIKRNRWGAAAKYYCRIHNVLTPNRLEAKSPYEILNGRVPDLKRMYFKVFGAPCQYKPLTAPDSALS